MRRAEGTQRGEGAQRGVEGRRAHRWCGVALRCGGHAPQVADHPALCLCLGRRGLRRGAVLGGGVVVHVSFALPCQGGRRALRPSRPSTVSPPIAADDAGDDGDGDRAHDECERGRGNERHHGNSIHRTVSFGHHSGVVCLVSLRVGFLGGTLAPLQLLSRLGQQPC